MTDVQTQELARLRNIWLQKQAEATNLEATYKFWEDNIGKNPPYHSPQPGISTEQYLKICNLEFNNFKVTWFPTYKAAKEATDAAKKAYDIYNESIKIDEANQLLLQGNLAQQTAQNTATVNESLALVELSEFASKYGVIVVIVIGVVIVAVIWIKSRFKKSAK